MNYPEAIEFLYSLRLFGAKFGLESTRQLAALVGNPQANLRFIHVAGTNGKGSTCAMLESIYRNAGLRTGLFTSPHLVSFRERIQVNRCLIPESDVTRLASQIQPLVQEFPPDHHPTFFEVVTIMALLYFAEQKCDLVIWETGLGGRLDATNIVTPLASVITNIAADHMQWLGDTLDKIATEKAGIIKPGVPVVTATDAPEALAVIKKVAQERRAKLVEVETEVGGRRSEVGGQPTYVGGEDAIFHPPSSMLPPSLPLLGTHQKINATLALAAVEVLQTQIAVSPDQIAAGLATVSWPGRMQRVTRPDGQQILLDGAHNAAGAEALRAALQSADTATKPVFIFGALSDKKWQEICNILAPIAGKVLTVPVASERTADARELAAAFQAANPALPCAAVENFSAALSACKHESFVVITGSLYLVGEALELLGLSPAGAGERGLNEWTTPQKMVIRPQ